MRSIIIPVILLMSVAGGIATWHFSAENVAKRQLTSILEEISEAASAQNQAALLALLERYLAPNGQVKLNVQFSVFAVGSGNHRGWQFAHTKPQFADFLREMIAKVNGYGMRLRLEELALDDVDETKFTARISASGFATGTSLMMGKSVGTRYIIKGDCSVNGINSSVTAIQLMDCQISLKQQADLKNVNLRDTMKQLQGLKP